MNEEKINKQIRKIVDAINNNPDIKRMLDLKENIYQDKDIGLLLDKFHKLDNEYSDEYIQTKKEIINNEMIKEYKELEKKLYFLVLEINKRLNELTNRKKCDL